MKRWADCPICGEPDMPSKPEGDEGGRIIACVNLNCGSNGGYNFNGVDPVKLGVGPESLAWLQSIFASAR